MTVFPECCYGCVPPKRTSTCHCTCKEYKDAKEEHEAKLEEERRQQQSKNDAFAVHRRSKSRPRQRTVDVMNCRWRK